MIVMAMTAALNRINDRFARYSWHFLPPPREKRKTFSFCREQTRVGRSLRRPYSRR